MKRTIAAVLFAVNVLLTAGHSAAVGPDDGVWLVLQSNPQQGAFSYYVSMHQNGAVLVVMLAHGNGVWEFGIGTRSGNTFQETSYNAVTGAPFGTWTATLTSSTTLSGSAVVGGVVWSLAGSKLF